jgi:hypothetical protein
VPLTKEELFVRIRVALIALLDLSAAKVPRSCIEITEFSEDFTVTEQELKPRLVLVSAIKPHRPIDCCVASINQLL